MDTKHLSLDFIKQLKNCILKSRYIVAKVANSESLRLYFSVGKIVEDEIQKNNWGAKVIDEISERLQNELPGIRGFSGKNIAKMRSFYNAWKNETSVCSTLSSHFQNTDNAIYSTLLSKLENNNDILYHH